MGKGAESRTGGGKVREKLSDEDRFREKHFIVRSVGSQRLVVGKRNAREQLESS